MWRWSPPVPAFRTMIHWFCSRIFWSVSPTELCSIKFLFLFLPRTHKNGAPPSPSRYIILSNDFPSFLRPEHEILQAFPRRRLRRRRPRRHGAGAHERDQNHGGPQKEEPRRLSTPPHVSFVFFFPSLVTKLLLLCPSYANVNVSPFSNLLGRQVLS